MTLLRQQTKMHEEMEKEKADSQEGEKNPSRRERKKVDDLVSQISAR